MTKVTTITPIQSDLIKTIPHVQRVSEFVQFAQWFATPRNSREHKNQKDFAAAIGVSQDTLTDWKRNPEFWPLAQRFMTEWVKERIPDVIGGLYTKACKKGHSKDVETFLRLGGIIINKSNK